MKDQLEKVVLMLASRIESNAENIKKISSNVKGILQEPFSDKRTTLLHAQFATMKELIQENKDSMSLKRTIENFLEKHNDDLNDENDLTEENVPSEDDENHLFYLTVNGEIKFDHNHPLFQNELFYQKLVSYYVNREDYEKCQEISQARNLNQAD